MLCVGALSVCQVGKTGPGGEHVTEKSSKPTRCLTKGFSVGMLKKDQHIDQWESCASVLSELCRKIPPMTSSPISGRCRADSGPASN